MTRSMRDSGIAWIGEIPEKWKLQRLKNCFNLRDGGNWGEEATGTEGDCICLRIADFDYNKFVFKDRDDYTIRHYDVKNLPKMLLQKDDIVIEKSGGGDNCPVGRTVIFDKDFQATFVNFSDRLRCTKDIFPKYMQYVFVTFYKNRYSFNYVKQTTGIQNLDLTSMLSKERIPLPPLPEQQKIAAFLDEKCSEIDAVLTKTNESIEEYKLLKNAIITQAVTKGIRPNRKMKDSGIEWIGEIPEEWEVRKGWTILSILERPVKESDGVITCFRDGEVTLRSKRREEGFTFSLQEIGYQGIEPGDLVVHGMDGFAGAIGISDSRGKASPVLNVMDSTQNKKYIMYFLRSLAYQGVFISLATGIRVRTCDTNWNKLKKLPYILPDLKEQQEISDYIDSEISKINELITKKEQLITELETYKKSLIYEYVTGKKEVQ